MEKSRILIVDDELPIIRSIMRNLERDDYELTSALDGESALSLIRKHQGYDVVICDLMMPDLDGTHILEFCKGIDPNTVFIMITAFSSMGSGIKAMSMGAFDFLIKPFDLDHLGMVVEKGLQTRRLKTENITLKAQLERGSIPPPFIGESSWVKKIINDVKRLSDSDLNVLIEGESGTGKEILARHIHYHSQKRYGPFVAVNCASIPAELLESELFGHEKGSFTGAIRRKIGLLEVADTGTFFLDEVNNLGMALQAKLLRALQDKSFMRVGGAQELHTRARIIAASNKNLKRLVEERKFREDLFYRLNVIDFSLPPLRDRIADVPLLARHFLEETGGSDNMEQIIDEKAIETLKNYYWPGNIRELRNVIERIMAFYDPEDLRPTRTILKNLTGNKAPQLPDNPVEMSLERVERSHIRRVLEMTSWNKNQASKTLKIDYTTLYRKMKKYGIETPLKKTRSEP